MTVIMNQKEIGEAIIKYLADRGIVTDLGHIYLDHNYISNKHIFTAEIRDVQVPPKDGPFR